MNKNLSCPTKHLIFKFIKESSDWLHRHSSQVPWTIRVATEISYFVINQNSTLNLQNFAKFCTTKYIFACNFKKFSKNKFSEIYLSKIQWNVCISFPKFCKIWYPSGKHILQNFEKFRKILVILPNFIFCEIQKLYFCDHLTQDFLFSIMLKKY